LLDKVKRKLELDDIAEFKTPMSKCARSSSVTKDIYSSYTGEQCTGLMIWVMQGKKLLGFKVQE